MRRRILDNSLILFLLLLPVLGSAQDDEEELLIQPSGEYVEVEEDSAEVITEEFQFDDYEETYEGYYLKDRERRAVQDDHGDVAGYAESSVQEDAETDWSEISKGFDYTEEEEKKAERPEMDLDVPDPIELDSTAWKYFLIALIAGVIIFILFKLLQQQGTSNMKVDDLEIILSEAEENIRETELEGLLRRAVEAKDHRLALRVRYLMVLKELDALGWIKHRIDKTNWTYFLELGERNERATFQRLTSIFEYAWYGDIDLSEKDDASLARDFNAFIKLLKQAGG